CVPKEIYACTDFPEGPIHPFEVWGGSMAVRSSVFREHRFAENIGPNGSSIYVAGSETDFTTRAAMSGHRCWHFRASPVGHIVRAHQLKPEWLLQRAYNHARGARRQIRMGHEKSLPRHALGFVRAAGAVTTAACRVTTSRLFGDFEDQFRASLR